MDCAENGRGEGGKEAICKYPKRLTYLQGGPLWPFGV